MEEVEGFLPLVEASKSHAYTYAFSCEPSLAAGSLADNDEITRLF